ncbi:MAG: transposase [Sphaerochaetaceae bacterium]|nr:transposase [Sphaerochaetaceae bacterium]
MKYSDELKNKMLEEVIVQHKRVCDVARQNGIPSAYLQNLVGRAREKGIDSCLHSKRKGSYSKDFKLEVVKYLKTCNSPARAWRRFDVNPDVASYWFRKYTEGGADALRDTSRSRILEQDTDSRDKQKDRRVHTESEYQELEKRLRRAEMELEFLKKLDALVQERIERERKR